MKKPILYADMHVHSNYSDGAFAPAQVVEHALRINLSAVALTDHDCIDGIQEAQEAGLKNNIEVISGVELSTQMDNEEKTEMHILGFFIDHKSRELKKQLDIFKNSRLERAYKILFKLEKEGIVLKDKSFIENGKDKSVGRLHFAKALIKEGFVSHIQEAFYKYLSMGRPAYEPKFALAPSEAIKLILKSGGVPVIAHPYYIPYDDKEMWKTLIADGLIGIEVWHSKHPQNVVKRLIDIAEEFDLLMSGGSDCHGPYKHESPIMGKVKVPYKIAERFKKKAQELKSL
ncbi:MAG: PHP domain-containing protein [Elusimicrobiota bacterium]|jgi:predicted metal-dependent phosphoesterase TrpH|nr:PHP domain-containing protein [Elusimicrobiota bacterium]